MILILSSHVCAGDVGGSLQVQVLARRGIDAALAPTVLFGRHPGRGAPGGRPVPDEVFAGMIDGLEADPAFATVEVVIAGYFASAGQVARAARLIDAVRAVRPAAPILVDPVMGDAPDGLYVAPAVAEAIAGELVGRADLLCPNLWELRRLARDDSGEALALARGMNRPILVSSVPVGEEIGVLHCDGGRAWLAAHPRLAEPPRGTGDRLTALYAAGLIEGRARRGGLHAAVAGVMESLGIGGAPRLERLA